MHRLVRAARGSGASALDARLVKSAQASSKSWYTRFLNFKSDNLTGLNAKDATPTGLTNDL
jgi:hypothetical protein